MITVFFSGAGLSAASGVPTYRGENGLYNDLDAEAVLSAAGYRADPGRIEAMHDQLAAMVTATRPNGAHRGIAAWARENPAIVITQNVDDLLERAGCEHVIHLHGELAWYRCRRDPEHMRIPATRPWSEAIRCPVCAARVRSDVVLFGEAAPYYQVLYDVLDALRPEDNVVVVGTQGSVVPIGALLAEVDCYKILNTLHPSEHLSEYEFDEVIYESAPLAWARIYALLMQRSTFSSSTDRP